MKFLLIFIISVNLFSLDWISYKEIYDNRPNKPIFVFVSKDNCKYCSIERDRMVKNKKFLSFLKKNFQTVYINQSKDFIPVYLMSSMTPAFYILESNQLKLLVQPAYGAIPLNEMRDWLEKVLNINEINKRRY